MAANALPLPDFHDRTGISKGSGAGDAHCYAFPLAEKVNYTNTFYDREPYLDITVSHPDQYGTYDFILSSDVFEHVDTPVGRAFEEAFRLLKPNGFLCITVPSVIADETVEHYPDLHQYSVVEFDWGARADQPQARWVKTLEIHGNLVFHGGISTTLEMRLFSQADPIFNSKTTDYSDVVLQMEPVERFGIVFDRPGQPLSGSQTALAKLPAVVCQADSWSASKAELDGHRAVAEEKAALGKRIEKAEGQLRLAAAPVGLDSAADWVWVQSRAL